MYTPVKPLPQSTHEIFPYLKCFLMSLPHFLEETLEEDSGQLAHFLVSRKLACQSLTACFILHCWPVQFLQCSVLAGHNFPQLLTKAVLAGDPDSIALIVLIVFNFS